MTYADVGSVDEVKGITGIAHIFEHMAFKGTKTIGTKDLNKEYAAMSEVDDAFKKLRLERHKGHLADPAANGAPNRERSRHSKEHRHGQSKLVIHYLRTTSENPRPRGAACIGTASGVVDTSPSFIPFFVIARWDLEAERLEVMLEEDKELRVIAEVSEFPISKSARESHREGPFYFAMNHC
jgi:hypothetical protein